MRFWKTESKLCSALACQHKAIEIGNGQGNLVRSLPCPTIGCGRNDPEEARRKEQSYGVQGCVVAFNVLPGGLVNGPQF